MPGYLLTQGFPIAFCTHGTGQVSIISFNQNVKILGQPVATLNTDQSPVVGCLFTVGTKPQPCVKVQWETAQNVKVNHQPVMIQTPFAQCYNAENTPQGFATGYVGQNKVYGI